MNSSATPGYCGRRRRIRIAARLLGGATAPNRRPAALLLSATPYRSYAERGRVGPQAQPHRELFDVVSFLGGDEAGRATAAAFERFGGQLKRAGAPASGRGPWKAARRGEEHQGRDRGAAAAVHVANGTGRARRWGRGPAGRDRRRPRRTDLDVYRHFADRVGDRSRRAPWPTGCRSRCRRRPSGRATRSPATCTSASEPGCRRGLRSPLLAVGRGWGSAKLRRLHEIADPDDLALPWVRPSLPWWRPAGPGPGSPRASCSSSAVFARRRRRWRRLPASRWSGADSVGPRKATEGLEDAPAPAQAWTGAQPSRCSIPRRSDRRDRRSPRA